MSLKTNLRIFNSPIGKPNRRRYKGVSHKARRNIKADRADGWERKQANSLRPQQVTAKAQLRQILKEYPDAT